MRSSVNNWVPPRTRRRTPARSPRVPRAHLVALCWGLLGMLFSLPAGHAREGSSSSKAPSPLPEEGGGVSKNGGVPQKAQEAKPGASTASGPAAGAAPASGSAPEKEPSPMSIPLVQGYDSFGLKIPDFDQTGKLRSIFAIGAVSRVDDRNVEIRDSFWETYKEDGSRDFSIDLPKATLDRFTRVLVAKVPVTIRRAEFELHGATMEFNTVTHEGGLGGPVRMVIYNGLGGLGALGGASARDSGRDSGNASSTGVSIDGKNVDMNAAGKAGNALRK